MLFFHIKTPFSFPRYLHLQLFGHAEKRLDQRDGVSFKICDVTTWLKNNRNVHIDQYLTMKRKSDNEIFSVNRI